MQNTDVRQRETTEQEREGWEKPELTVIEIADVEAQIDLGVTSGSGCFCVASCNDGG